MKTRLIRVLSHAFTPQACHRISKSYLWFYKSTDLHRYLVQLIGGGFESSGDMADQGVRGLHAEFENLKGVEHRKNNLIQVILYP